MKTFTVKELVELLVKLPSDLPTNINSVAMYRHDAYLGCTLIEDGDKPIKEYYA